MAEPASMREEEWFSQKGVRRCGWVKDLTAVRGFHLGSLKNISLWDRNISNRTNSHDSRQRFSFPKAKQSSSSVLSQCNLWDCKKKNLFQLWQMVQMLYIINNCTVHSAKCLHRMCFRVNYFTVGIIPWLLWCAETTTSQMHHHCSLSRHGLVFSGLFSLWLTESCLRLRQVKLNCVPLLLNRLQLSSSLCVCRVNG